MQWTTPTQYLTCWWSSALHSCISFCRQTTGLDCHLLSGAGVKRLLFLIHISQIFIILLYAVVSGVLLHIKPHWGTRRRLAAVHQICTTGFYGQYIWLEILFCTNIKLTSRDERIPVLFIKSQQQWVAFFLPHVSSKQSSCCWTPRIGHISL